MADPFDLDRFVGAQDAVFAAVLGELRRGRKTGHWMWFVFPQLAALGRSATARHFGISGLDEARAYLAQPTLGRRFGEAADALLSAPGDDPVAILGSVDTLKLASSMTLFEAAGAHREPAAILARFCGRARDPATLALLGGSHA